jgi:hypothetical protein
MEKQEAQSKSVKTKVISVAIPPPKFEHIDFRIEGTAPLVIHKFSSKVRAAMREKHANGGSGPKAPRAAKDFDQLYKDVSREGWYGIPAASFRHAMISACRTVNYKMTHAKLAFWIQPDGFDADEGTGLIRVYGTPKKFEAMTRNETGVVDIRIRPMWDEWRASVKVHFDGGMFSASDIANLMMRAGLQVGVCEGRPDSKNSPGMGWGTFALVREKGAKNVS